MSSSSVLCKCVLPVLAVLAATSTARGVVLAIDANVTAEVRESSGGSLLNSDFAFDEWDVTSPNLPIVAEARLLPPAAGQSAEQDTVVAEAVTRFSDPRLNPTEPPNEFSLDAVGFSDSDVSTVTARSLAVEMREIVFQADETEMEDGTAVIARSHLFLDGLMVLLGESGRSGLAGARAELTLRIIQERSGSDPATVLEATVVLTGNSDGTASLEVNGALTADNLTTFGLDAMSSSLGTFQAVVLPNLSIPYTYPADIGETFDLRAEIEAQFEAAPGTGAMIVLGDRLNEFASVLQEALGEEIASDFQTGLTEGMDNAPLATKPLVATQQDTILEAATSSAQSIPSIIAGSCGALGLESVLLAVGLTVLGLTSRQRG